MILSVLLNFLKKIHRQFVLYVVLIPKNMNIKTVLVVVGFRSICGPWNGGCIYI